MMNADYTGPLVAPKLRFVGNASLKLTSPRMSAACGSKPSIAPKPKVTPEVNGNHGGCINDSLQTSGVEEHKTTKSTNRTALGTLPAEESPITYVLKSSLKDVHNVSWWAEDGEVTEEEKEEEEDMIRNEVEDWRSTDSALTEEADSLETAWVSDVGLTAESEEVADTDITEDTDAEGFDAGEALADTDGLSVEDISVNSTDEVAGCCAAENQQIRNRQEQHQIKEDQTGDCTADDSTESLTDEAEFFINDNYTQLLLTDRDEDRDREGECATDHAVTYNIHRFSNYINERDKYKPNISIYDFLPKHNKHVRNTSKCGAEEDNRIHEHYDDSSEDVIDRETVLKNNTAHGSPEAWLTQQKLLSINSRSASAGKCEEIAENDKSCEDYVSITNNGYGCHSSDENKVKTYQKWSTLQTVGPKSQTVEDLLNRLDHKPSLKLVSISLPTDTESSLTSSLSESRLLSPNDSDVSRDEDNLEGYIVPFLEDTNDTAQDISDERVYEEPGQISDGGHVFPFDKRSTEMTSHSLSQSMNYNFSETGVPFVPRSYMSGLGNSSLTSSPMLNSIQKATYAKPHYLSLYHRSHSMEGQAMPLGLYSCREGSSRQGSAIFSSGSFSRSSTQSSSGLSTPTSVVDIPPPFELAYITKRPITKSSPSLFIEGDSSEKNKKKKSSIKRFLMLKFGRKTDSKSVVDVNPSPFKPSVESSPHMSNRLLDPDRHSISSSPRLNSYPASKPHISPELNSKFLLYEDHRGKRSSKAFLNRSVVRVESFKDHSPVPFKPLPLTKPRSISFPNADGSDYENVPAISSDYENLQVPLQRPVRQIAITNFFDRSSWMTSSANETDGYVDMSSLAGFKGKTLSPEQETESAYTEAYNVCSVAVAPQTISAGEVSRDNEVEEDQGRTSEEEDGGVERNYDRLPDGRSRAFYIAKELLDTERSHVKALKFLQEDFREAVEAAVGDEGEPVLDGDKLREILNELPDVYFLHRRILSELENRIQHWEESQTIADIFLSRKAEFLVFTTYIGHYDRSMSLLEESCQTSPVFAAIVQQFEQSPAGENVSLKYQLLKVIVRVAQYGMLLTDYLNNLSPDSKEYEDTQAAVAAVSDIADQANDSLIHGENLLRLVNIEYSVHGQQDLLQPCRVFVKEGTLMKVSRKSLQPRHLFLMNDVLLYTYPLQDGKYRLKNTLPLVGLKVKKPIIENVHNALRIEGTDISITLSAGSFIEREDWFYTLNRSVTEHIQGSAAFNKCSEEVRDRLRSSLGDKPPTLVPLSQVMMCMNCTTDFSLTLRRHHCHGCGRIVCRSCCRNRYQLKYMKDRMAKVCDHCYNELKKRGDVSAPSNKSHPHPHHSSRPLSAVFQNLHPPNIWRHRKGTASFTQMTVSEEGSISGSLQCSKKSKRSWKRLWFHLKDKVLYTYQAQEEKVASESLPLLGFTVKLSDKQKGEEVEEANIFQLYHKNTLYYTFKAVDTHTAQRWANAMEEATVL